MSTLIARLAIAAIVIRAYSLPHMVTFVQTPSLLVITSDAKVQ